MSGQIFVSLRRRDRIEQIMPYLKLLARRGMQVVFLTSYREKVSWMEIQLTALHTGTRAMATITALAANASREAHMRRVAEKIRPAREALQQEGATVVVQYYTGSLQKGMTSFSNAGTGALVLVSKREIIRNFIAHVKYLMGLIRTGHTTPILLLRPRRKIDVAS